MNDVNILEKVRFVSIHGDIEKTEEVTEELPAIPKTTTRKYSSDQLESRTEGRGTGSKGGRRGGRTEGRGRGTGGSETEVSERGTRNKGPSFINVSSKND